MIICGIKTPLFLIVFSAGLFAQTQTMQIARRGL
jgi:hypothetical protein